MKFEHIKPNTILQEYIDSSDKLKQNIGRKIQALLYIQSRSRRDNDSIWDDWDTPDKYKTCTDFLLKNKCFQIAHWLWGLDIPKLGNEERGNLELWENIWIEEAHKQFDFPFFWIVNHQKQARHIFVILWKDEQWYLWFEKDWNWAARFFHYEEDIFKWDRWDRHLFLKEIPSSTTET